MSTTLFPEAPSHGMVFELQNGLYFKYDATIRSWIKIASTGVTIPLATMFQDGAMSAIDLRKLNRLMLPPPVSSIIGTDCVAPFQSGAIGLYSGDKFVGVEGTIKVQNIGPQGELLSQDVPFHIHQHTYGFDFTIDFPELIEELRLRNQFNVVGKKGDKGDSGIRGEPGPDDILTGEPGDSGDDGPAPSCELVVEPDDLQVEAQEGVTKALVGGRVVFDDNDPLKYKLVFDRQLIGPVGYAADKFHIQDDASPWILAVAGDQNDGPIVDPRTQLACGVPGGNRSQKVYYIDIEPIVDSIRDRFLREADIIKGSYQNVVKFWLQTMSDLFDEQKTALCCALEHCKSIKKNAEVRHDIESLAASAAGSANILLHGRDSSEAVSLSSTRTLKQIGGPDLCRGGPRFPQFPTIPVGVSPASSVTEQSQPIAVQHAKAENAVNEAIVVIDPLINSTLATAVQVPTLAGDYTAILSKVDAKIDGKYRADVKIQYFTSGVLKIVQFLDKGEFNSVDEASNAYEGLAVSFRHDGGMLSIWLPSLAPRNTTGAIELTIQPSAVSVIPQKVREPLESPPLESSSIALDEVGFDCRMSTAHLAWYERGWLNGNCCGVVINVMGQDYIVVKRTFGNDVACGGGESESEPCVAKFLGTKGHPAFAWPTFDGKTFVPLPADEFVTFHFDEKLNEIVSRQIADGEFEDGRGNPAGVRHLTYQLMVILFPSN